jgi:antitoxin ParD1/3/4
MLIGSLEAILPIESKRNNIALMDDIRISLSDGAQAFVDAQLAEGNYASVSECIDAALRAQAKAEAQEKLEALLLEGLDSGDAEPWTDENWDALRRRIAQA